MQKKHLFLKEHHFAYCQSPGLEADSVLRHDKSEEDQTQKLRGVRFCGRNANLERASMPKLHVGNIKKSD